MSSSVASEQTSADMLPLELTMIVAATRKMGIGKAGGLPWTGLKKEMAYFARVTKRSPQSDQNLKNVVIMGNKTWKSIPTKFAPLKGRLNIVLSRSHPSSPTTDLDPSSDGPVQLSSLLAAIDTLKGQPVGKVFIVGGAEIYKAALDLPETKRLLLTRVLSDFDCDTHLDLDLEAECDSGSWKKSSKQELDAWTGEEVPNGEQEENGTKYVFEMYEKVDK